MDLRGMPEAKRIEELLGRYVERHLAQGLAPDPEELCRDAPELLEPLRECIREYQRLDRILAPAEGLTPGRNLLHYRIARRIGAGGMGEVYLAEDRKLGRKVALKVLPPEMASDPGRLERFRREARVLAALNHPNIVTLFAVDEAEGLTFLTMELVEGRTLAELIPEGGLPPEEILSLALPLAEAVSAAHDQGITHRDLKPANVMVSDAGMLKVLDFGLAKPPQLEMTPEATDVATRTLLASGASHLTRSGLILGTVPYMAPEQVRGRALGPRSDVFSLGVVLYEMSTGRRPFDGATASDLASAILRDSPSSVSELRPGLPTRLGRITDRCLAKDPQRRYPTAGELRDDLAELRRQLESGEAALVAASLARLQPPERYTVGREQERAELAAGLAAVAGGSGLLLCVAGEPGIGKTTLVENFLAETAVAGPRCWIARGRCSERLAGAEAYLPFLDVLGSLLENRADGSVAQLMRRAAPWWYVQLASLSPDDPADANLAASVRGTTQERLKRELGRFLEELCRKRPAVFFFDDLHWSDASTIDLLAYLAGRFEALRLLIVATYRPEELLLAEHPFLRIRPDLTSRGLCREVAVGFLSRGEIEDYLALEFPGHGFPADLAQLIHHQTEGNPLFMTDLVRYLRDRGVIAAAEGGWELSLAVADIRIELPESVRGMIQRKVEHLGKDDRRLLVAAGVQGYEFDSAVVCRVLELDAEEVEDRLQTLDRDHGFVRFLEEQELPDRTLTLRYRFVHVLYQNELFGSLTRTKQARLSRSVATTLLDHHREDYGPVAAELAALFESARDFAEAVTFLGQAAQNALQVFAYREAILLANRGLRLLENLPDTTERAQLELGLQISLGLALMSTRGYACDELAESNERKRELIQSLGETPQLFPAQWSVFAFHFIKGDLRTTLKESEPLAALARHAEDSSLRLLSHHARGLIRYYRGDLAAAREHLEEALSLYDPRQHGPLAYLYGSGDIKVNALIHYSLTLWLLGYPDRSLEHVREAVALSRELAQPYSLSHALLYASMLHQMRRESQAAQLQAKEGIELDIEHGFVLWLAAEHTIHGWALATTGEAEAGITETRQGLEAFRATGANINLTQILWSLADGYYAAGKIDDALAALAEALAWVDRNDEHHWQAEVHRLEGQLLLARDPTEPRAEELFRKSLDVARERRAKSLELRAAISLSRLWQARGRRTEARELLAPIHGWFTEGFDTADLKEAQALLEEADGC